MPTEVTIELIPKQTCGNCRHWKGDNVDMNMCILSKGGSRMMRSGCGLRTDRSFSCILWQSKAIGETGPENVIYPQKITNE